MVIRLATRRIMRRKMPLTAEKTFLRPNSQVQRVLRNTFCENAAQVFWNDQIIIKAGKLKQPF